MSDATVPQLRAPIAVRGKDVSKFKEKAQERVVNALDKAVIEAMKEIKVVSLAIHTPDELKKTNGICAAYLKAKTP